MTVKSTNRSHRVICVVALLMFAAALTTALVLAGERKPEGRKTGTLQPNTVPAVTVGMWGSDA